MMPRQLNRASIHVAGIFCLLLLAYHLIFRDYFPLPNGRMGHDYVLTLGGLLDGYLWFRNNGFITPPWFTPSFCGGQPFFADPQSIFYSLPQFLTFITDPLQAVYWAFLVFAGIGFWGMYLFARSCLDQGRIGATIAGSIFMFNGFYAHRMIVGHYGYQSFMLVPLIAYLLLRIPEQSLRSWRTLGHGLGAGALIAYCFQSGLTTLMVPAALAVVALACLSRISTTPPRTASFLTRSLLASIFAIGLCASKLNANLSLIGNFTRDYYPLPGIADIGGLLTFVFQSLFYSSEHVYQTVTPLWKNMQWAAMPHELAFSLTPATLLVLLAGGGAYALSHKKTGAIANQKQNRPAWLLLAVILILPLGLLYYTPGWNEFLKKLPLIGATTSPYRWLIIYLPLLAAISGIATQATGKYQRWLAALTLISLPLLNGLESRDYYQQQNHNPAPVVAYYNAVAQGRLAAKINGVADPRYADGQPAIDNELFLQGLSPLRCYNPIYGYRQEKLITAPLQAGPIDLSSTTKVLNLHNPACQVFPAENHCQPGDAFNIEQKEALYNFAGYKPYAFTKSGKQQLADLITLLSLGVGALLAGLMILRCLATAGCISPLIMIRRQRDSLAASSPTIQLILLLLATTLFVIVISRWIPANGLSADDLAMIRRTFVTWPVFFQPEPRERAEYLLSIVLFPALSMLFTAWLVRTSKKWAPSHNGTSLSSLIGIWCFFLLLCAILFAAREAPFGQAFGFSSYTIFSALVEGSHPILLLLLFLGASWASYREIAGRRIIPDGKPQKLFAQTCDIAAIGIIVCISARISFIPEDTGAQAWAPDLIHMAPIFEAAGTVYLTSATAGANMVSQYGGLVEFARPLLWLMGGDPLALMWFAFLALAIAGICQWLAVRKVTGNPLLAMLAGSAVFYFTSIKFQSFVCFQCGNFRWLWPSIYLCLAAYACQGAKLRCLPYILFPIATYWNPETGLAAGGAWIGWRVIANTQATLSGQHASGTFSLWAKKIGEATLGFGLGLLLIIAYVVLKSGQMIDPVLMSRFAKDFYLYGFYMLPMPGLHLWNIYALACAGLLLMAIRYYANTPPSETERGGRNGFIAYACLLFALLFSYYQGRSYYGNLLVVSYPLWLAIAVWSSAQKSGLNIKGRLNSNPLKILGNVLICLGFAASIATDYYLRPMENPFSKKNLAEKAELQTWVKETAKGRTPLFISFSAWRLQLIAGTSPGAEVIPLAALLRRDQLDHYIGELNNPKYALYYDPSNDIYFQIEQTFWAKELKNAITQVAPQGMARGPVIANGQGRLILLNPSP